MVERLVSVNYSFNSFKDWFQLITHKQQIFAECLLVPGRGTNDLVMNKTGQIPAPC